MKVITAMVALACLVFAGVMHAAFADAVVDVEVEMERTSRGVTRSAGNGTCVEWRDGYALILTAGHITDGRKVAKVTFPNRKRFVGTVVAEEPAGGLDLAAILIKCQREEVSVHPVAGKDAAVGDTIWLVGDSFHAEQPIRKGKKVALPDGVSTPMAFRTDIDVASGDSGGGIFNADGELLSVTSGHEPGPSGLGRGAETASIRAFLAKVRWPK